MKYILLAYEQLEDFEARDPNRTNRRIMYWTAWKAYGEALAKAGVVESMHSLLGDYTATTVRLRNGKCEVRDGPYANTDDQIGGYFVIDVSDLDEALMWARSCPAAASGTVEVRPLLPEDCLIEEKYPVQ